MKHLIAALLCFALLVGILSACMPSEEKEPINTDMTADANDFTGLMDFSFSLFKQSDTKQSSVLSPLSVYYCLTLAANAANGETEKQLVQALGGTAPSLNDNCQTMMERLDALGGTTTLEIANAVFADARFELNESYRETVSRTLQAGIFNAELSSGEGVTAINNWASEKTHGEIPQLLSDPPGGPAVLLNAVYLKAVWENPFAAKDTKEGFFTTIDGTQSIASFMEKRNSPQIYLHTDGVQGLMLPYDDGSLCFVALLPDEYDSFIASLDAANWQRILGTQETVMMDLKLPRFSIEQDTELNDMLRSLGITDLFSPSCADLTGLEATPGGGIYVERAFQKAKIDVGEEGTVAAAVTGIVTRALAKPSESNIRLSFDRPFVYAIIEKETGVPIFLGTVTNP